MVITVDPALAAAIDERARLQGKSAEDLALSALRERFLPHTEALEPRDDWERGLLALARDCGVSLSDADLSRETLYE